MEEEKDAEEVPSDGAVGRVCKSCWTRIRNASHYKKHQARWHQADAVCRYSNGYEIMGTNTSPLSVANVDPEVDEGNTRALVKVWRCNKKDCNKRFSNPKSLRRHAMNEELDSTLELRIMVNGSSAEGELEVEAGDSRFHMNEDGQPRAVVKVQRESPVLSGNKRKKNIQLTRISFYTCPGCECAFSVCQDLIDHATECVLQSAVLVRYRCKAEKQLQRSKENNYMYVCNCDHMELQASKMQDHCKTHQFVPHDVARIDRPISTAPTKNAFMKDNIENPQIFQSLELEDANLSYNIRLGKLICCHTSCNCFISSNGLTEAKLLQHLLMHHPRDKSFRAKAKDAVAYLKMDSNGFSGLFSSEITFEMSNDHRPIVGIPIFVGYKCLSENCGRIVTGFKDAKHHAYHHHRETHGVSSDIDLTEEHRKIAIETLVSKVLCQAPYGRHRRFAISFDIPVYYEITLADDDELLNPECVNLLPEPLRETDASNIGTTAMARCYAQSLEQLLVSSEVHSLVPNSDTGGHVPIIFASRSLDYRNMSMFFKASGIPELFLDKDMANLFAVMNIPNSDTHINEDETKEEDFTLTEDWHPYAALRKHEIVFLYYKSINDKIRSASYFLLDRLGGKVSNADSFRVRSFTPLGELDSLKRYTALYRRFLITMMNLAQGDLYSLATVGYELTEAETLKARELHSALYRYFPQITSNLTDDGYQCITAIIQELIELIVYKMHAPSTKKSSDATTVFLSWNLIKNEKGALHPIGCMTQTCAYMMYLIKATILEDIMKSSDDVISIEDKSEREEAKLSFVDPNSRNSSFYSVLQLFRIAAKFEDKVHTSRLQYKVLPNHELDKTEVTLDGTKVLSLKLLSKAYKTMIHDAQGLITELFGSSFSISNYLKLGGAVEDIGDDTEGYAWFTDIRNKLLLSRGKALLQLCHRYNVASREDIGNSATTMNGPNDMTLREGGCRTIIKKIEEIEEYILMLKILSNEPSRRTEYLTEQRLNALHCRRNVFLQRSTICLAYSYNKRGASTQSDTFIPKFLPQETARLDMIDACILRPALAWFNRKINPTVKFVDLCSYPCMKRDGFMLKPEALTSQFSKFMQRYCFVSVGMADYRQLIKALVEGQIGLKSIISYNELEEHVEDAFELLHMRFGHSSRTGQTQYGRTQEEITTSKGQQMETGYTYSINYQRAILGLLPAPLKPPHREINRVTDNNIARGRPFDSVLSSTVPTPFLHHVPEIPAEEKVEGLTMRNEIRNDYIHYKKQLSEYFGSPRASFKSSHQAEAVKIFTDGKKDLLYIAATGGGKSLTYMLPAKFLSGKVIVVVLPTIALIQDVKRNCSHHSISCEEWDASTFKQRATRGRFHQTKTIMLVSVEAAITNAFHLFLNHLHQKSMLFRIVVDECHLALLWLDFKQAYRTLYDIGLFDRVPLLFLTATLSPTMEIELKRLFCLDTNNLHVIRTSCARKDLLYKRTVLSESTDRLQFISQEIKDKIATLQRNDRIIAWCRTKADLLTLKRILRDRHSTECSIYHSDMSVSDRQAELDKCLAEGEGGVGKNWVIAATVGLAFGIHYKFIPYAAVVGMPAGMCQFVQMAGRGLGTSERASVVEIFLQRTKDDAFYNVVLKNINSQKYKNVDYKRHDLDAVKGLADMDENLCLNQQILQHLDGGLGITCFQLGSFYPCNACKEVQRHCDQEVARDGFDDNLDEDNTRLQRAANVHELDQSARLLATEINENIFQLSSRCVNCLARGVLNAPPAILDIHGQFRHILSSADDSDHLRVDSIETRPCNSYGNSECLLCTMLTHDTADCPNSIQQLVSETFPVESPFCSSCSLPKSSRNIIFHRSISPERWQCCTNSLEFKSVVQVAVMYSWVLNQHHILQKFPEIITAPDGPDLGDRQSSFQQWLIQSNRVSGGDKFLNLHVLFLWLCKNFLRI